MVSVTVVLKNRISAAGTIKNRVAATATILSATTAGCPTITVIDGGDTGSDSQFTGTNGYLDGGTP